MMLAPSTYGYVGSLISADDSEGFRQLDVGTGNPIRIIVDPGQQVAFVSCFEDCLRGRLLIKTQSFQCHVPSVC